MLRLVICWPEIVGHMVPCFKALAAKPGVQLLVVAGRSGGKGSLFQFQDAIVAGLNCQLIPRDEMTSTAVAKAVTDFKPDVVSISGWGFPAFRQLASLSDLAAAKFIMVMDTPRRDTWRQKLGKYRYASYFARIGKVAAIGERAFQTAKLLGFEEARISRGAMCGIDSDSFAKAAQLRAARPEWPKRFLFTGRYNQVKALDILLEAYAQYRRAVSDPWPLSMCGSGPLEAQVNAAGSGVENLGFVQPADQIELYSRHGVFVLASRYDPWPLVIVEACAAGLPVICTEACGSAVECVRTYYNGLTVPTDHAARFSQALSWMHNHHAELSVMGPRGIPFAAAFSAEAWANRWIAMLDDLWTGRRATA